MFRSSLSKVFFPVKAKSPNTKAPPISGKTLTMPITLNSLSWTFTTSLIFKFKFLKIFSLTNIELSI